MGACSLNQEAMRGHRSARLFGRAQGLALPPLRVPVTVLLVPISNSGWGLRELARASLVGTHGVVPGRALRFGLTMTAGCLPGVLARLVFPFAPVRRSSEVRYVKAEISPGGWHWPVPHRFWCPQRRAIFDPLSRREHPNCCEAGPIWRPGIWR